MVSPCAFQKTKHIIVGYLLRRYGPSIRHLFVEPGTATCGHPYHLVVEWHPEVARSQRGTYVQRGTYDAWHCGWLSAVDLERLQRWGQEVPHAGGPECAKVFLPKPRHS